MKIPFKRLNFSNAEEEIRKLLQSGWIGLGPKVFELEEEFAKYVGSRYAIATDSCTSALFISLKYFAADIEREWPITIPSMTVPLVGNAVIEAGYELYFNDDIGWVGNAYTLVGSNIIDVQTTS